VAGQQGPAIRSLVAKACNLRRLQPSLASLTTPKVYHGLADALRTALRPPQRAFSSCTARAARRLTCQTDVLESSETALCSLASWPETAYSCRSLLPDSSSSASADMLPGVFLQWHEDLPSHKDATRALDIPAGALVFKHLYELTTAKHASAADFAYNMLRNHPIFRVASPPVLMAEAKRLVGSHSDNVGLVSIWEGQVFGFGLAHNRSTTASARPAAFLSQIEARLCTRIAELESELAQQGNIGPGAG
jgi:hypothetical protein